MRNEKSEVEGNSSVKKDGRKYLVKSFSKVEVEGNLGVKELEIFTEVIRLTSIYESVEYSHVIHKSRELGQGSIWPPTCI